jgi:putative ABC transport system substrate-binding protein
VKAAAESLGLSVQGVEVRASEEFEAAFDTLVKARAQAVLVIPDSLFGANAKKLAPVVVKSKLPSMFGTRTNVDDGGLMSYGPDLNNLNRQAAIYVDKILKGAKPADLPVQQPTAFQLVINLKTATALGITIPQSVLQRADEVIQ